MSVFKEDPDTFAVVAIRPGSPASEAGILVGDKLTEINGQGTAAMSGDEVSKLSRGAPGTILHITVDRQGQLLTFAVTLAEPRWDNANP
jgi:C-terminal processing protease CtpA/Prc